jgi:phosphate transport system substrate-binding protein
MSFRSIRRALLPLALATAALGVPGAEAVPNLAPACASAGVTIDAHGATFSTFAWNAFINAYAATCGAGAASITYNNPLRPQAGSGTCVEYMETRTPPTRSGTTYPWTPFCGSDDALNADGWASANSTGGAVAHIPVAVGAVTVAYNNPACPSPLVLDSKAVSDLFEGNVTTWNAVTRLDGTQVCPGSNATITRVVRDGASGTTWIFRDYLRKRNATWNAHNNLDPDGPGGTAWPNPTTNISYRRGNTGVADGVVATAGSVGYVDLATAVSRNNAVAQVQTVAQTGGTTGTNPYSGASLATAGAANCNGVTTMPPHANSAGWDSVTISDGPQGYPICGFTYGLVFTNSAAAFGANVTNAQVKAAVDLMLVAVSASGQAGLGAAHYAPLPQHAQVIAQAGLASVLF